MALLCPAAIVAVVVCALATVSDAATSCRANAVLFGTDCYCINPTGVATCTSTQDCGTRGCECRRMECSCGEGFCTDVAKCDTSVMKCKCGVDSLEYKLCDPREEECDVSKCICNKTLRTECEAPTKCKNQQCYCGDRVCNEEETCMPRPSPYCACGNFGRTCNAFEVCVYENDNFYCKCGNRYCRAAETCQYAGGSYSCKCGDRTCAANEQCVTFTTGAPSVCLCGGRQQCATYETCTMNGATPMCKCGANVCRATEMCKADGTCMDLTCTDLISSCSASIAKCYDPAYERIMKANCARTCSFCPVLCVDRDSNCAYYGCTALDPTLRQLIGPTCPRSCGYC